MIFRPVGVQFVSFYMYVVSFVKRALVLKRSSPNDFQISAALMPNAQSGCKRPSVGLD
jgi:hypothetical protein